jgi:hypothetical protein
MSFAPSIASTAPESSGHGIFAYTAPQCINLLMISKFSKYDRATVKFRYFFL